MLNGSQLSRKDRNCIMQWQFVQWLSATSYWCIQRHDGIKPSLQAPLTFCCLHYLSQNDLKSTDCHMWQSQPKRSTWTQDINLFILGGICLWRTNEGQYSSHIQHLSLHIFLFLLHLQFLMQATNLDIWWYSAHSLWSSWLLLF